MEFYFCEFDRLHRGHVPADEVRRQLETICQNRRFRSADRNTGFLRYVVENTLEGKANEIKEVVIGIELYGRQPGYDPKADAIVRVEAARLRAKLASYYREEGRWDPVLIDIPKGAYIPRFEHTASYAETYAANRLAMAV